MINVGMSKLGFYTGLKKFFDEEEISYMKNVASFLNEETTRYEDAYEVLSEEPLIMVNSILSISYMEGYKKAEEMGFEIFTELYKAELERLRTYTREDKINEYFKNYILRDYEYLASLIELDSDFSDSIKEMYLDEINYKAGFADEAVPKIYSRKKNIPLLEDE